LFLLKKIYNFSSHRILSTDEGLNICFRIFWGIETSIKSFFSVKFFSDEFCFCISRKETIYLFTHFVLFRYHQMVHGKQRVITFYLYNKRVRPTKNEPQQAISYLERAGGGGGEVREREGLMGGSEGSHI
jgi:hypothetical protein